MDTKNIKKIEEIERLVWALHAPYYIGYPTRDYAFEKWLDDKVLYYIKLGYEPKDLLKKIKRKEKEKNAKNQMG